MPHNRQTEKITSWSREEEIFGEKLNSDLNECRKLYLCFHLQFLIWSSTPCAGSWLLVAVFAQLLHHPASHLFYLPLVLPPQTTERGNGFSLLCIFTCGLKLPARAEAKSHWLHLFDFSPLHHRCLPCLPLTTERGGKGGHRRTPTFLPGNQSGHRLPPGRVQHSPHAPILL